MERFKRFYGQLRDNDHVFDGSIDTTSFNEEEMVVISRIVEEMVVISRIVEEMGIHWFYLKESVFIYLVEIWRTGNGI